MLREMHPQLMHNARKFKTIWEQLLEFGVDYGQGYLFSRPRTADSFIDWLKSRNGDQTDRVKDMADLARTNS